MADTPGEHLTEEPQEERGPKGSRDQGSSKPSRGPANRPSGDAGKDSETAIKPQKSTDPDAPDLQSGG